jgi:thioredoxin reductase (NADPH)
LLIEKGVLGGQIANAELVENYPGFPEGIPGVELGRLMGEQAVKFGLEILNAEVLGLQVSGPDKIVSTSAGDYSSQALILASGSDSSGRSAAREGFCQSEGRVCLAYPR